MSRRSTIGSAVLLVAVLGTASALAAWKHAALAEADATASQQPEQSESVTVALAERREHRQTTTSIGTVVALRSITLRNELPGTVRHVHLVGYGLRLRVKPGRPGELGPVSRDGRSAFTPKAIDLLDSRPIR